MTQVKRAQRKLCSNKSVEDGEAVIFKSIVIAFDGSAHASKALDIAADIAEQNHSRVGVIYVIDSAHMGMPGDLRRLGEIEHVIEPAPRMVINFESAPPMLMDSITRAREDSQAVMSQFADYLVEQARKSLSEATSAEVETSVVVGDPAQEIVNFARQRQADLIITGCRGLGKLKRLVLGSTSQAVTQQSDCSCLTVK